jgi:hypothetical protein
LEERTFERGLSVIRMCVKEFNTRFLIGGSDFTVKVADKDGIRALPVITAAEVCASA